MSDGTEEPRSQQPMDPNTDAGEYELRRDTARELTERILGDPEEAALANAIRDAEETAGMVGGNDQTPWVGGDLDEVSVGSVAAPQEERTWSEVVAELPEPGTTNSEPVLDTPLGTGLAEATVEADTAPIAREVPVDTESQLGHVPSFDDTPAAGGAPVETMTPGPGEESAPLAPDAPQADLDDLPNDADTSTVDEALAGTTLDIVTQSTDEAGNTPSMTDINADTPPAPQQDDATPVATVAPEASDAEPTGEVAEPTLDTADEVRAAALDDLSSAPSDVQVEVSEPIGVHHATSFEDAAPIEGGDAPIPNVVSEAEAGIESLPPALEMKLEGTSAQTDPQAQTEIEPPLPASEGATGDVEAAEAGSEEGRQRRRRRRGGGGGGRQGRKLDTFAPGEELQGTVRSVQPYGAFVDVGAERDGLVHISELKDGFVEKVEDVVKEGDAVTVRIKDVDVDNGRLSLTMRAARPAASAPAGEGDEGEDRPERGTERRERRERDKEKRARMRELQEGQEVTGTVTSIVDFGAFVDIGASTDGLIHISELSEDRVNRVTDVLQEGQEVTARVLSVDRKRNRISLSLKPQPEPVDYAAGEEEGEGESAVETPSVMEAAFARARERNRKDRREDERREKRQQREEEIDDIIERTLRNRL